MKENKKYTQLGLMIFGIVAGSIVLYFIVSNLSNILGFFGNVFKILTPVTIGICVAYLINPIVMFLDGKLLEAFSHTKMKTSTKKKLSKGIAIGVSLVGFVAIIALLLYLVVPEVIDSLMKLVSNIQSYGTTIYDFISDIFKDDEKMQAQVQEILDNMITSAVDWIKTDLLGEVQRLMSTVSVGIVGFFKTAINIFLGLCVAVYLLVSKNHFIGQIKKLLYAIFKKETVNLILAVGRQTDSIFGGFISGKIIDSLIIGILCFIGCSIMKMPYLTLVSVVVGVTNVIPLFGPWIGAVPCTLLILIISPKQAIIFAIFIFALQQFDGNILGPTILGDSTGLSAFWVVVAITLGSGLFGLAGMILGVPTFAVFYFLVKTYMEFKLKEHNMSVESNEYTQIKRIDPETLTPEYVNKNVSKREMRKQNVFQDEVTKEVAIAARLSREEREKREKMREENLGNLENFIKEEGNLSD